MLLRISLTLALLLVAAGADARNLTVQQAEEVCLDRAERFATTPTWGVDSSTPPPTAVVDRFVLCVYAKSGQSAQRKLRVRGFDLTLVPR